MKSCVAYVDDDKSNLELMKLILGEEFEVETFNDPDKFLASYSTANYVAVVLDVHMPKMSGFTLQEKIMEHPDFNGSPILFISSDDSDESRIKSFTLGAVDFMNRKISPTEILARVKSKIEFFKKHRTVIEFGNLRVNLTLLKAFLNNKEIALTFTEFKLLTLLLKFYPELITKQQVIDFVWNKGVVLDATLYTHVSNLNSKLVLWDHEIVGVKTKGLKLQRKDGSA